mgnify:CR=1 FL=1
MRGKEFQTITSLHRKRITPACAGKRSTNMTKRYLQRDHPRMCGEKHSSILGSCKNPGSPPHVRGKAAPPRLGESPQGITPACAGKSLHFLWNTISSRDHPRMCGEKRKTNKNYVLLLGSPPHVRGKVNDAVKIDKQTGITPACAGKSRQDGTIHAFP